MGARNTQCGNVPGCNLNFFHFSDEVFAGTRRSGMGGPVNRRRHGFAIQRAQRAERATRALSVAMPVSAYIRRYSFEIRTKARRALTLPAHRERLQINRIL